MSCNVGSRVGGTIWRSIVDRPSTPWAIARPRRLSNPPRISFDFFTSHARSAHTRSSFNVSSTRPLPLSSAFIGLRSPNPAFAIRRAIWTTQAKRDSITGIAGSQWKRSVHCNCKNKKKKAASNRRNKSSTSNGSKKQAAATGSAPRADLSPKAKPKEAKAPPKIAPVPPSPTSESPSAQAGKALLDRLPHIHRPTKQEFLDAATGFWSRLRVHFKWFTIKSVRPFNMDDISAFFSWIIVGHVVWIILGTTTFFSLVIFLVNTVFAQETLAKWIGEYLTQSSGVSVIFESAVVPKWKDGVISFQKVFVSRRPGQAKRSHVAKGSQESAAAAAAAAAALKDKAADIDEEDDGNYTQFDVSIDNVNVTLSFSKWFNGKGLLRDVEVKGIRGVFDRTHLIPPEEYVDPRSYKHEHNPGDFELDSFKMEDLLVTIYQPDNFRPFSVSIFSCDLPQLRQQWLFYDFLSANNMSGSFDNSLFTIHPRQTHNYTGQQLNEGREMDGEPAQWKKHSRIRIDGLNIDHLNRGYEGPFSWIHSGNVDIVADIMFPADNNGSIAQVMSDFYDRMEATVTSNGNYSKTDAVVNTNMNHDQSIEEQTAPELAEENLDDNRFMVMDLRVHLNDVHAAVPLFTRDISYVNNALIRPIVAYINSRRTFIPVNCRVVKRSSEFDGSWTIYDSGLMDDLSREMYEAFARDVMDDSAARKRRIKKVGIWTLQLAAQALFIGLAGNIA